MNDWHAPYTSNQKYFLLFGAFIYMKKYTNIAISAVSGVQYDTYEPSEN